MKRLFCLDAHRVTDLAAFPIQSVKNEALTELIMTRHEADFGGVCVCVCVCMCMCACVRTCVCECVCMKCVCV